VVGPSLVIRAGLLQHLVEDSPLRGTSRFLALNRSDEIIIRNLLLALLDLLLLLAILLGALT